MLRWLSLMGWCVLLLGCGRSAEAQKVSVSEASVELGLTQFEGGDWEGAEKTLAAAVQRGGLMPDLAETALRTLALAHIRTGHLEDAEQVLDQLAVGASEMDRYWLARAELELGKGASDKAKQAVSKARESNRRIEIPDQLKSLK